MKIVLTPLITMVLALFPISFLFASESFQNTISLGVNKFVSLRSEQIGSNTGLSIGYDMHSTGIINLGTRLSFNFERCDCVFQEFTSNISPIIGMELFFKKNEFELQVGPSMVIGQDRTRSHGVDNQFTIFGFGVNGVFRYEYKIFQSLGTGVELFYEWEKEEKVYGIRFPLSFRI